MKSRKFTIAAVAFAAAITLSACTGGTSAPPSRADAEAPFNDADVMFAQMMIPHHEQAVDMSDMLLAKDDIDEHVRSLASQIKDAQQPEIAQLDAWLADWGADEGAGSMDHGTDGMMSDDDMGALDDASGDEASRLFLEQMIVHHEGAVEMARTEINDGVNSDAVGMAETIVSTQSEEIDVMRDLLGSF